MSCISRYNLVDLGGVLLILVCQLIDSNCYLADFSCRKLRLILQYDVDMMRINYCFMMFILPSIISASTVLLPVACSLNLTFHSLGHA